MPGLQAGLRVQQQRGFLAFFGGGGGGCCFFFLAGHLLQFGSQTRYCNGQGLCQKELLLQAHQLKMLTLMSAHASLMVPSGLGAGYLSVLQSLASQRN